MFFRNSTTVFLFLIAFSTYAEGSKTKSKHKSTTKDTTTVVAKSNVMSKVVVAKDKATEYKIKWLSWEEMVKLNEINPKKIFIDFYTSWCGWCKVMDRNTFEDSIVASLMVNDFYCVKFDAERKDTIQFLGKPWLWIPGGRGGYHSLAAYFMQNQLSYPTFCVLTSKFELISPLKGYIAPPQFEPIISYLGKDLWMPNKNKNLETYKQEYKTPRTIPWVQKQ
jgi:thioredoxin-related protein